MTAVGKILVFINLVFSLIVAALVVTVYMAQTRWAAELKKSEDVNKVLIASNQAFQDDNQRIRDDAAKSVAEVNIHVKKLQDELTGQTALVKDKDAQIQQLKIRGNSGEALTTASQVEATRRQTDMEKLRETLGKEQQENARLVNEENKMRERAVAAEIQFKASSERADRMEKEMQRLAQDNARLKSNLGGGAVARRGAGERNPPPENVEGLIKSYDPASGLMTITIGADAGVTKGNTLEVFRLASVPSQSKYVGTIRIVEAGPNYAVGQAVGRMLSPPQVGDRVASRILGS